MTHTDLRKNSTEDKIEHSVNYSKSLPGLINLSRSCIALTSTSVLSSRRWINEGSGPAGLGISSHGGAEWKDYVRKERKEKKEQRSYFLPLCGNFSIRQNNRLESPVRLRGENVSSQTCKSTEEFANVEQVTVAWRQVWTGPANELCECLCVAIIHIQSLLWIQLWLSESNASCSAEFGDSEQDWTGQAARATVEKKWWIFRKSNNTYTKHIRGKKQNSGNGSYIINESMRTETQCSNSVRNDGFLKKRYCSLPFRTYV